MHNIYIETYGCSANQNNSEIIAGMLAKAGLFIVQKAENADIIILNTCIVKGPTESKMRFRISELIRQKKPLIVTGCMPDVEAKAIKKISPNISLLGVHHIKEIINVVRKVLEGRTVKIISKENEIKLNAEKIPKSKIIGITQISEGCLGQCSYCFTRMAKGKLFSYPKDLILNSIQRDIESGAEEIWITSQDCGAYGLDNGKRTLPELLSEILKLKGKFFLRLGMMNPNNVQPMLDKLIELYKHKKMFKFLHIPMQSGSDSVLKDMGRKYQTKDFSDIIDAFRKEIPDIVIATDIICGYPSEKDEDFQKTLDLMKQTKPDIININRFWAMPKTKASRLKQLSREEIKKRALKMSFLHKQIGLEKNKLLIGQTLKCIIDEHAAQGMMGAKTMGYKQVLLKSGKIGEIADVKIANCSYNYLIGE